MAAASVRLAAPSLPRMLDTCTLAVLGAMNSTEAISLLLRPAVMSRSTSRSLAVSEARTAPSPRCSAVPILARGGQVVGAFAQQPAFRLAPRGGTLEPRAPPPPPAARLGERL